MAAITDSRIACYLILERVLIEKSPLDSAVDFFLARARNHLSDKDRGFIRHLTTTCLRRLGQIDKVIDLCTESKLSHNLYKQRMILRIGVTQLLFMEVADHAAVNMTVGILDHLKNTKMLKFKGMVNAVLRRTAREKELLLKKTSNTRLNMPQEMLKKWDKNFGQQNVKEILEVFLKEPPLDIMLKPDEDRAIWQEKFEKHGVVTSLLPTSGLRLEKAGSVPHLSGYEEGAWWVQDVAATLPAVVLGAGKGDYVLDLCAAPGGKTAQSAAKGSKVTAVDLSERRLIRLEKNMDRLDLDVFIVQADAGKFVPADPYDYILLDAPCSSSGTLRRHPEMAWTRDEQDIYDLVRIQKKMLEHVTEIMPSGGTLVYCVCSMEYEEGLGQIKKILQKNKSLKRQKISADEVFGLEKIITAEGDIMSLPHHLEGGMDGFFIARLVKE
jgi:16S rRNA (cytosine967-C5)-methyltransferase